MISVVVLNHCSASQVQVQCRMYAVMRTSDARHCRECPVISCDFPSQVLRRASARGFPAWLTGSITSYGLSCKNGNDALAFRSQSS